MNFQDKTKVKNETHCSKECRLLNVDYDSLLDYWDLSHKTEALKVIKFELYSYPLL